MPRFFRCLLPAVLFAWAATHTLAAAAPASLFDYDRSAPLDVHLVSTESHGDAVIRDITFVANKTPVKAFVVAPAAKHDSLAGILYVHWLGEPATTNRTEFLNEAVVLASLGTVSVLVDTMWAQPKWYEDRIPEHDYADSVTQVIALRRAMDLLLAQPGIDPQRIAYVGHDFGAMYGAVMLGVDHRVKTCVLMAGVPHFIDWFLYSRQPKDLPSYRAQLAPLDPVNFLPRIGVPAYFQFAAHDQYVTAAAAAEFYGAALPRKQMTTYDAKHDLHTPEVAADRVAWLIHTLGLKD